MLKRLKNVFIQFIKNINITYFSEILHLVQERRLHIFDSINVPLESYSEKLDKLQLINLIITC